MPIYNYTLHNALYDRIVQHAAAQNIYKSRKYQITICKKLYIHQVKVVYILHITISHISYNVECLSLPQRHKEKRRNFQTICKVDFPYLGSLNVSVFLFINTAQLVFLLIQIPITTIWLCSEKYGKKPLFFVCVNSVLQTRHGIRVSYAYNNI